MASKNSTVDQAAGTEDGREAHEADLTIADVANLENPQPLPPPDEVVDGVGVYGRGGRGKIAPVTAGVSVTWTAAEGTPRHGKIVSIDAEGIARCTSDTFSGDERYLVTVPVSELRRDPNPPRYEVDVDRKTVLATDDLSAALDAAEAHGGRPREEFFAWPTTRAWIGADRRLITILDLQGPPVD